MIFIGCRHVVVVA